MVMGALAWEEVTAELKPARFKAKHSVFGVGGGKGEFPGKGNIFKSPVSRSFSKMGWEAGNSGKE